MAAKYSGIYTWFLTISTTREYINNKTVDFQVAFTFQEIGDFVHAWASSYTSNGEPWLAFDGTHHAKDGRCVIWPSFLDLHFAIFKEGPGQRPKDCFLFRFLPLQFTLFTLLKNSQVNFIVQISKFPSQNTDY